VYINGVKLVSGSDYTATSSTVVTLTENALSGDVVEVTAITEAANLVEGFFTSLSATTTSEQVLSTNGIANKSIKYVVSASHSSGVHSAEVLLINDGTNAYFVQYGDVYSGSSLFTLSTDVNSGNMRLLVTPANTNTTFKTFQIRLT
jgi:hypothetical protein